MPNAKNAIVYRTAAGREPFTDWLNSLRDPTIRRRILKRLLRLEQGNYGDFKPVGEGVKELRFFFGTGSISNYGKRHVMLRSEATKHPIDLVECNSMHI